MNLRRTWCCHCHKMRGPEYYHCMTDLICLECQNKINKKRSLNRRIITI